MAVWVADKGKTTMPATEMAVWVADKGREDAQQDKLRGKLVANAKVSGKKRILAKFLMTKGYE